jgi:hypothetical protein
MRLAVWGGTTALIVTVSIPLGVASTAQSTTAGGDRLPSVAADSTAEREIRDLLNQSVRAALSLESATAQSQIADFERDYASDYISVGSGRVFTRSDIVRETRERGPNRQKFSSVEMQDTHVRIHGDTAVTTYVMSYSLQTAGGLSNRSVRESAVFVKRDGRWLRVLEHRTNLTTPAQ